MSNSLLVLNRPITTSSVYIVGAGYSLHNFDFECLRQRDVLAVNDTVFKLPFAKAVVSADAKWIQERFDQCQKWKLLVVPDPKEPRKRCGTTYFQKRNARGLSETLDVVHVSGTSGYAALNIAYLLGYSTIYLLGFDYKNPSRRWTGKYEWKNTAREETYQLWAAAFDSTLPQLKQKGVSVFNASPESAITAFPKIELESI